MRQVNVCFKQVVTTEPHCYWYHPDHLGSSSWITYSDGSAVQHLHYLPWGEDFVDQRSGGWNSMYTFSAKEKDTETGYSYFGSRYYSSDLSIWLSLDPMSDKYPSMSPYTYCANNPIKLVDPNGEEILIGNYKYTIGADCPADLKGDDAKAWNSLNSIAKHKLGGKVVTALCNSTKEYTISTGCEGSKNLYSKNKVDEGTSNKPGGKISVVSNPSSMENVIAHEMFHAYQDENGQYGKTVHNEVEAFMFEAIVCGTGTENLAPNGNYPIKDPYVAAFFCFKNWDKNPPVSEKDFNSVFRSIRHEFMTKSKASTSGDYSDCDTNIPQKNLLRELMFGK